MKNMTETDNAKEFAESVKRGITQQSAIAMLAQANAKTQSVLQLLG